MAPPPIVAATTEIGSPALSPSWATTAGTYAAASAELNPQLTFPASALVYDRMRSEDGQVASVLRAITLPILGTRWSLAGVADPDAPAAEQQGLVRPEVAAFVASELGLDTAEAPARLRRHGIVWRQHLREALTCLVFGFAPFEIVYAVGPASPGQEQGGGRQYAHLRKLAHREPRTLLQVRTGADGGLDSIVQAPPLGAAASVSADGGVVIPVDRLVMYVNDREGAAWTGRSVLRSSYKHWLIKDRLMGLGAQVVERNGMGVPVITITDESQRGAAEGVGRAFRAGAASHVVLSAGMTMDLMGVTGSTADELPRIAYQDHAMSRSLLAMFLDLGHDAGARSLGETFVDLFLSALQSVIANIEDTVTEHVIRDLVEINYGPAEPYPTLRADPLQEDAAPTAEALKALADAGLLTPGRDLEDEVRRRYGLTAQPPPVDEGVDTSADNPFASVGLPSLVAAGIISLAEARTLLGVSGQGPAGPPPLPAEAPRAPAADLSAAPDPLGRVEALAARIAALRAGHQE